MVFTDFFTLLYLFFCFCVIAPPQEAVSAGLTIQNLFERWCGSEELNFVYYHIRRTTITIVLHALLPLGYVILCVMLEPETYFAEFLQRSSVWLLYDTLATILFALVSVSAWRWSKENWDCHPIARKLSFLAMQQSGWRAVASSINVEFRRPDKFSTGLYSRRVYITDSWIIRTTTYSIDVAPLGDVVLTLQASQDLHLTYDQPHGAQFLNIRVACANTSVKPFDIRLNAQDYNDLKDRLQAPVRNVQGIVIQPSLAERFLAVFREHVNTNGKYRLPPGYEESDQQCIGCMVAPANVKLVKQCMSNTEVPAAVGEGGNGRDECRQCYCRPLWCVDCMGRWFAQRQPQDDPSLWLAGKAPCPMCRATFCAADVCMVGS